MLRIITAFPKLEDAKKLKNLLDRNGYDDVLAYNSASQVIAAANESDGGIVVCGYQLADMHYSELYGYLPTDFRMLLVASPSRIQECAVNSIMCLPMPIRSYDFLSTLRTVMYGLARDAKKSGRRPPKRSGKEQKSIDDAKALLMERNHMTEEEAHRYIQKLSMDSGNNMAETAEMILMLG